MSSEAEVKNILSILEAWRDPRISYEITAAGWEAYAAHADKRVQKAVAEHPHRLRPISYRPNKVSHPAA